IIFLLTVMALKPFSDYSQGSVQLPQLIALLVCLIPTTIAALTSAIGIAGMDRLLQFNVVAKSGRAVEAAGDVDLMIIDKTGTITMGNRMATEFLPKAGVELSHLAELALLSSIADETPEGRSIVVLAKDRFRLTPLTLDHLKTRVIAF